MTGYSMLLMACLLTANIDDELDRSIESARAEMAERLTDLRSEIVLAIEKIKTKLQDAGNLDGVNELLRQMDDLEQLGKLPTLMQARAYQRDFSRARTRLAAYLKARSKVEKELGEAIRAYTKQGEIEKANLFKQELQELRLDFTTLDQRMASLRRFTRWDGTPWTIAEGELWSNPKRKDQVGNVFFGDPAWSEYDLSYEFKYDEVRGLMFTHVHSSGHHNARKIEIGTNNNTAILLFTTKEGRDDPGGSQRGDMMRSGGIESGAWHRAEFKVRGASLKLTIDGKEVIEHSRADFTSGKLAFGYKDGADVRIRKLAVKTPSGGILWNGVQGLGVKP